MISPEGFKKIARGATVIGTVATLATVKFTPEIASASNITPAELTSTLPRVASADCLPSFYKPTSPEVRGALRLNVERIYKEDGKDVTGRLAEGESFDVVDEAGNTLYQMNGLEPRFGDIRVKGKGNQFATYRARWERNQAETDAYVIDRVNVDGKQSWERVGDTAIFSGEPVGLTDVKNLCGILETRRYTEVQKYLLLKDEVLKSFESGNLGITRIIEDCLREDNVWWTHIVRTRTTPYQPKQEVKQEEIKEETKKIAPVQLPIRPVPNTGDGSMSTQVMNTR